MSSTSSSFASFTTHSIPIVARPHDPTLQLSIHALRSPPPASTASAEAHPHPLLLIHGHPQNSYIWHKVAPRLAESGRFDLVLVDLRGHGKSGKPAAEGVGEDGHGRYTKREMALDLVDVMIHFGFQRFSIVGHDRGGRVAHRLAVDHPDRVEKVMLLDICPTLDMYNLTDQRFASLYWHWFFLIQPSPFPEDFILSNPSAYLQKMVTRFPSQSPSSSSSSSSPDSSAPTATPIFSKEALDSYLSGLRDPQMVHAMCEDYRASAPGGPDLRLDAADRGAAAAAGGGGGGGPVRKIRAPVRILWGARGVIQKLYDDPLALWAAVCEQSVRGRAVDAGHYLPEEASEEVVEEIGAFFT